MIESIEQKVQQTSTQKKKKITIKLTFNSVSVFFCCRISATTTEDQLLAVFQNTKKNSYHLNLQYRILVNMHQTCRTIVATASIFC